MSRRRRRRRRGAVEADRDRRPPEVLVAMERSLVWEDALVKGERSDGGDGGDKCIPRLEEVLLGLSGKVMKKAFRAILSSIKQTIFWVNVYLPADERAQKVFFLKNKRALNV